MIAPQKEIPDVPGSKTGQTTAQGNESKQTITKLAGEHQEENRS
jgi:hypothetical protein